MGLNFPQLNEEIEETIWINTRNKILCDTLLNLVVFSYCYIQRNLLIKIYIIKTEFVEREKEQEENSQFNYNWFFLPQLPPPKPRVWEQRSQGVTPKEDEENERDGERKREG